MTPSSYERASAWWSSGENQAAWCRSQEIAKWKLKSCLARVTLPESDLSLPRSVGVVPGFFAVHTPAVVVRPPCEALPDAIQRWQRETTQHLSIRFNLKTASATRLRRAALPDARNGVSHSVASCALQLGHSCGFQGTKWVARKEN